MRRFLLTTVLLTAAFFSSAQSSQTVASQTGTRPVFMKPRDWGGFNRYAAANAEVKTAPRAIFLGDSITDFWAEYRPEFFSSHNYLGRGIGAQTVEQMLTRFQRDVVDLHPKTVVILAGINDIAQNNGPMSLENIAGCIQTMCESARANNIIPIVCSLLPCDKFYWNPEAQPASDVIALNELLKAYTRRERIDYVDYHTHMALPDGSLPEAFSKDGCHPTVEGYARMEEIIVPEVDRIIDAAEKQKAARNAPADWADFKRYEQANASLSEAPFLVLMGDSITDNWFKEDPAFFKKNNFAGRGISGQTASQMLVRFGRDVINLRPKAVAIMAGTNDICQSLASMSYYPEETIIGNIIAMCELAENAGIKVLLCSVTPCAHYLPIPTIDAAAPIVALNAKLKAYAASHKNVTYVDYFSALANDENGLDDNCSYDGIHPTINVYDDMERILVDAVIKNLKPGKRQFYTIPAEEADRIKAENDAKRKEMNMPMNFGELVKMFNHVR